MQELKSSKLRVVGLKQTVKAIKNDILKKVYIANDADAYIKTSIMDACQDKNFQIIYVDSMKELGEACGIDIGASTAGILKD